MPMRQGFSRATVSINISRLMQEWVATGKLGKSSPPTATAARSRAIRIALSTARKRWKAAHPRRPYPSHLVGGVSIGGRALIR